jgi:hypothetical protein
LIESLVRSRLRPSGGTSILGMSVRKSGWNYRITHQNTGYSKEAINQPGYLKDLQTKSTRPCLIHVEPWWWGWKASKLVTLVNC